MKTLAKVGATSNSLWWALNGVGLLFACSKCGKTVRKSPYRHDSVMVIGMQIEILNGIKKLPFYGSFQIFK